MGRKTFFCEPEREEWGGTVEEGGRLLSFCRLYSYEIGKLSQELGAIWTHSDAGNW